MKKKIYPLMNALMCIVLCIAFTQAPAADGYFYATHVVEGSNSSVASGSNASLFDLPDVYLTTPGNNATLVSVSSTFKCKTVSGASDYTLQLSSTVTFSDTVATINSTTTQFPVSGLQYSTTYYARVKSSASAEYGKVTTFTTKSLEDYAFISTPKNGAVNVTAINLKITANQVADASQYTIDLSPVPDFSTDVITRSSKVANQRTITFDKLPYNTLLYARVKTNISGYGKTTSFTTKTEEFSMLISPTPGSVDNDPTVLKIAVNAIASAKRYTVEINTESDFSAPSLVRTSLEDNQTEFIFKNLPFETTLYVRSKTDISTTYGPTKSFTTRARIQAQRLWGLTSMGGAYDKGTIFSFSLDSLTFTKHRDYVSEDEYAYLSGSLTQGIDRTLYGNSNYDATGDGGKVFHINSETGAFEEKNFHVHHGSVILGSNNYLYVLHDWINSFRGGLYRAKQEEEIFSLDWIIFRFRSDYQGINPEAPLIERPDGYLYGTAPFGGSNKRGTLFRIQLDGKGFEVVHTFNGTTGAHPNASVTDGSDGYLYGMTPAGGAANFGVIFKIKPDGSDYTKLIDFNSSNGKYPLGSLMIHNGKLYGMTSEGGSFNKGVIFSLNTDGSAFTKLYDFNGTAGAKPLGALSAGNNGSLYGMTSRGGDNDYGVIFKIQENGSGFENLFTFSTETGGRPDGNLLLLEDTFTPALASTTMQALSTIHDDVIVHPNPFEDHFTTEFKTPTQEDVRIVVSDMNGNILNDAKLISNSPLQLGEDLKRGMYILKVIRGDDVSVQRLVKK